jgi:hypothetical protein
MVDFVFENDPQQPILSREEVVTLGMMGKCAYSEASVFRNLVKIY